MKKYMYLFALVFGVLTNVNAQSKAESQVAAAVEVFRTGIVKADKDILTSIAADSLVYGHSNGKVQNKTEFVAELAIDKPIIYSTVTLSQQTIKVSGNAAVVRHIFSAEIINNGKPGNLKIGNTLIFQKTARKMEITCKTGL